VKTWISFIVHGTPLPQPRPATQVRRSKAGKAFAHIYTPSRIEPWRKAIRLFATAKVPAAPLRCPVKVEIAIALEREKQMAGPGWPADLMHADNLGSGDVDNFAKPILDVMTEMGFWVDDAQVVSLSVRKFYVEPGADPGAHVSVGLLNQADDFSAAACLEQLRRGKGKKSKKSGASQLELIGPREPAV
jgi:Holliday junction resolvase RusA-like endonuclease